MLMHNGKMVLSIGDWNYICKCFNLAPQTVAIKEVSSLTFIETRIYDIRNNKVLLSLFSHDNKIRVPTANRKSGYYEMDVADIFKRDGNKIDDEILKAVQANVYCKNILVDKVTAIAEKATNYKSSRNKKS